MKDKLLLLLSSVITLQINAQDLVNNKKSNPVTYSQLKVDGNIIKLEKSNIELDKNGFPKQIQTFYDQFTAPINLLYENIHFHFVRKSDGKNISLRNSGVEYLNINTKLVEQKGKVKWKSISQNDSLIMEITGTVKNDGVLSYRVQVKVLKTLNFKDVTMHIPFVTTVPTHMMGFGIDKNSRPEKVEWKWDGPFKTQSGAWLGNQDTGMKYILDKGDWSNKGKGGVSVGIKGSSMLANNYTGDYEMKKDETRYYNFQLFIKPFNSIKK